MQLRDVHRKRGTRTSASTDSLSEDWNKTDFGQHELWEEPLAEMLSRYLSYPPNFKLCLRRILRHLQHLSYTPSSGIFVVPLRLTPR
jgi:hypothetical protein